MDYKKEFMSAFAEVCKKARKEGYYEGFNNGLKTIGEGTSFRVVNRDEQAISEYERGLNDAWECAKKLVLPECNGGLSYLRLKDIFASSTPYKIMIEHSPSEVISRIKQYENECNSTVSSNSTK